jgi:hypothetical protein
MSILHARICSHVLHMDRYIHLFQTTTDVLDLFHACYTPHLILDFPNSKIWPKDEMIKLIMLQCAVNGSEYTRTLSRHVRKIAKSDY